MPPPSTTTTNGGSVSPLSPQQQEELTRANERAKKVLSATKVATFNGWTIGIFAAITLLFALFSVTALVVGAGMAIVAWNEFRGRTLLRRFDPHGPRLLGRNQLGFMGLLIGYGLWGIFRTLTNPIPQLEELEAVVGPVGDLVTDLVVVVYGGVILLSLIFPGLNARYYFARIRLVRGYLDETPAWIIDVQRSSSGL
ncbi:MAG: hypothetical protein O7D29_01175 [Gemmatimonadetes bacterium]|nr:hypothetical protein [Gemmatimonadota bacterium]